MPVFQPSTGMPGVGTERTAKHRIVGADGYLGFLPGGAILDGTKTRDPDNPDDVTRLRAGLLLGKVTSGGKYANAVIGVTAAATAAAATSLTVSLAQAAELVRRQGATGTFTLTGPPTAAGTVAAQTVTYSAVNTSTGVVTTSAIAAATVAGSLVGPTDGSQVPVSFLPDGWELILPVGNGDTGDLPLPTLPIEGAVNGANLLPWPADSSLKTYVRTSLKTQGTFTFVETF